MFALILETLSTTEVLFILVIALIFFGPRKLPQLARSIGKSLADFRKASEDFKRTWEREVAVETARIESEAQSILDMESDSTPSQPSTVTEAAVEPADSDLVVARDTTPEVSNPTQESAGFGEKETVAENSRKHDWL